MIDQALYLLTGAMAGILAGLLGVGGGIVVVPILDLLFTRIFPESLLMHMAIGTSLAIMIFTAASATYAYHRRGLIIWRLFFCFIPGMVLGTITGSVIAMYLSSNILRIAFAGFLLIIAVKMFETRKTQVKSELPHFLVLSIVAFFTGILSGFFGIGGGVLMVPFFVYCNVIMQNATATSSACGFVLSIVGTLSFILTGLHEVSLSTTPSGVTGFVYWAAVLPIAISSMLFAPVGTRIAIWFSPNVLQRVFAVALIITALELLRRSF